MHPSPWWRNWFQCIRLDAQNWLHFWWFTNVTLNQDSSLSMMLGCGLADQGLEPWQGQRIFGASKTSRLSLGSSRSPIQWVPKFFLHVKAAWAWSLTVSSTAEVRNKWSATSTPHTPSLRAQGQLYFYPRRVSAVAMYPECFYFFKHEPWQYLRSVTTNSYFHPIYIPSSNTVLWFI